MRFLPRFATREGRGGTAQRSGSSGSYPSWQQNLPLNAAVSTGALTGGYSNPVSGAGGSNAKAQFGRFQAMRGLSRAQFEVVYVQSWAAKKFIDIPVEDSIVRWRDWDAEDEEIREGMAEAEMKHDVKHKIAAAYRSGRLMGTGMLLMITKEASLETPLDPERIKEGDLVNLLPVDRYSCAFEEVNRDVYDPEYGMPVTYRVNLPETPELVIHSSRALRFDGILPTSAASWQAYEPQWGISELVPTIVSVLEDSSVTADIAQLVDEASIPILKLRRFREAIAGNEDPETAGPFDTLMAILQHKSVFHTMVADEEDDFSRVNVSFGGLPEIMDRFAHRLAAAADIPMTRFFGTPPSGLNATGESDMKNYAIRVEALQHRMLDPQLSKLDEVLMRDAGLGDEVPEYEWRSLIELGDLDQSEVLAKKVQAINAAVSGGWIDENEAREIMSGDEIFGELEEEPMFLEERAEEEETLLNHMLQQGAAPAQPAAAKPPKPPQKASAPQRPQASKSGRG